ncbi:MAG: histone deacetylase [Deltaproteobacteria bacterium]|nr:histone deacetylase [Deltaproteobacteria bacterium]
MTCVFTSARCLEHRAPAGYPERPERLDGILVALQNRGIEIVEATADSRSEVSVEAVHDPEYVGRFERAVERGDGLLDSADNPLSPNSWKAAWGAVHATVMAARATATGEAENAFSAVRPPGHHAERGVAMGFCFLNNAAVAADYLLRHHGLERVAIFDFDVHHGNGTQHIFEHRKDVFYASTHQHPFYPGTGQREERGLGQGEGATLNVPLPMGTGDEEFLTAVDNEILPALAKFQPEVLIASAGFDIWQDDPLGGFQVSLNGIAELGKRLRAGAQEICDGRLFSVLEGGYDLPSLGDLAFSYLTGDTRVASS